MNADVGVAKIRIEGDWDLEMIGDISHAYVEVYSAASFLLGPSRYTPPPDSPLGSESARGRYSYPWRGGYSAVHFFHSIFVQLPKRYRPEILEINYASPGFIELVGFGLGLSFVVSTVTKNADRILGVYKTIQEEIRKRKLNDLDLRQRAAQTEFVERAYSQMVATMELPSQSSQRLHEVTQRDSWARLKILLALARRIDKVAQFERSQAAALEEAQVATEVLVRCQSSEKRRKLKAKLETPLEQRVEQISRVPPRTSSDDDNE